MRSAERATRAGGRSGNRRHSTCFVPAVTELQRLLSVVDECGLHYQHPCPDIPGPIGVLCVVGRGCWGYGSADKGEARWIQAKLFELHDEILHFVGVMSNSCFSTHADREGTVRNPSRGAGGGIGNFILTSDTYEVSPIQLPLPT